MPAKTAPKRARIIKIVLDQSANTRSFDLGSGELIHQQEFQKADRFIREMLENQAGKEDDNRLHQAITILGTRGSGKTSFLLSLRDRFDDDGPVKVLRIIDPTLIEEKGHVFLNIIALIVEAVEEKWKKTETVSQAVVGLSRKEWQDQMRKLAGGLPSIVGIGKENMESWQEPEFVMETGLNAVKSAINLADNFDKFVWKSLQILGKSSFLVFFDDIDVDSRKGLGVLETIRKYLTTSKIITVVSGDLKLYSAVIRQKKWQNFGPEILKYEGKEVLKMSGFNNMVTELATQYLLKVMQPRFRIHLTTLLEKRNADRELSIEVEVKGKPVKLELEYGRIFGHFGVKNETQLEVYITFMMGLPLRSQIQFLIITDEYLDKKGASNEMLSDVFIEDLLEKGVDINLANHTTKYLVPIILRLLLQEHRINECYQLQPSTTDLSLNSSLVSLWILLSVSISKPNAFLIFEYFIKIAYIRNLSSVIPYRDVESQRGAAVVPSIEGLCEAGDVFNDGVLREVTGAIQAYVLGAIDYLDSSIKIPPFFIHLRGLTRISKQGERDRIDVVFAKADKATCILAFMPCSNGTYNHKNESRVMYSVYVLLAAIGELVKQFEVVTLTDASRKTLFVNLLRQLSQLRSHPIPNFRTNNVQFTSGRNPKEMLLDGDLPEKMDTDDARDTTDKALAEVVIEWIKERPKIPLSAHLLGKIFTRFYYSMSNIANAVSQDREMKLGRLFHYQICAFMNAALVEDATENMKSISLNINNTRLSERNFLNNLKEIVNSKADPEKTLQLSRWLLGCPLLIAYLDIQAGIDFKENLVKYYGKSIEDRVFNFSIQKSLDKVRTAIQGQNSLSQARKKTRPNSN